MKWSEPWMQEGREFKPFSARQLRIHGVWVIVMSAIVFAAILIKNGFAEGVSPRFLIAPVAGFLVSIVIYIIYWLTPGSVSLTRNGIVHDDRGTIFLIPYGAISEYGVVENDNGGFLEIRSTNGRLVRFVFPKSISGQELKEKIRREVRFSEKIAK